MVTAEFLQEYGYLPTGEHYAFSFREIEEAWKEYKEFNSITLETLGGDTDTLIKAPRCRIPDNVPHSLGSGSWPHGCYGEGHEVRIKIDQSRMPGFLEPVFDEILGLVKQAYLEIGMMLNFVESGRINIDFSFERLRGSAIGVAIVPRGPSCNDRIWCKYDYTYQPSNVVKLWAILIMHELGHNMGLGHTRGGIMNPSILSLPASWSGDPAEATLRRWFSGHDTDPPPPPPEEEKIDFAVIKAGKSFFMSGGSQDAKLITGGKTYHGKLRNILPN